MSTDLLTRAELIASIKEKPLVISFCTICTFPCAYYYNEQGQFGYDAGCDCVSGTRYEGWQPRSEDDLDFYLNLESGWLEILTKFVRGE